jgi:hypothetical protein
MAFVRLLERKSDCAIDEQSYRRKWEDRGRECWGVGASENENGRTRT